MAAKHLTCCFGLCAPIDCLTTAPRPLARLDPEDYLRIERRERAYQALKSACDLTGIVLTREKFGYFCNYVIDATTNGDHHSLEQPSFKGLLLLTAEPREDDENWLDWSWLIWMTGDHCLHRTATN